MPFKQKEMTPGEHQLNLTGKIGRLETIFTWPANPHPSCLALLGHPHSLQGGTMNNKVVTTMARAFKALGIPSLRFNFRGVGLSQGEYDAGVGESEDMLELAYQWQAEFSQSFFIFAGFSFGSYVAYRAAAQRPQSILITIAPPVHHYDYQAFSHQPDAWFIIQGEKDDIVPAAVVAEFAHQCSPKLPIIYMDTGHFFHGQLLALKTQLMDILQKQSL